MKEYKVVKDSSTLENNNSQTIEKRLNQLAKEGFEVVSSCAYLGGSGNIYIILERDLE